MTKTKPIPITAAGGTRLEHIPIGQVIEPELAARATMSDQRMVELMESIKAIGLIEPITAEQHDAMFEIVTGHRRFLAVRQLGWEKIPAIVYAEGTPNILAMRLHENIAREDLNPAEEALYMAQSREKFDLDEEGLCRFFHVSASYLATRFALLRGDPKVFEALQAGEIRLGAAGELNRITDEGMRRYYLDICRRGDHPQRVVHQWVQDWFLQSCPSLPLAGSDSTGGRAPSLESGAAADATQSASARPPEDPLPPAVGICCQLCGGNRDPYNLVTVMMHKWEWEEIQRQIRKAAGA